MNKPPSPLEMDVGDMAPPEKEKYNGIVPAPQSTLSGAQAVLPDLYISRAEFPLTHFRELESRVFAKNWSIPYKRDESLGVCMLVTIKLIREGPGVAEADENCRKFLLKTMPDAFNKVLLHEAVLRWNVTILDGISNMCKIALELIAERLKQRPIPVYLLDLLAVILNNDTNFHNKLRNRKTEICKGVDVFAQMPSYQTQKDPKGCLVDMMNTFAQYKGVEAIRDIILNTADIQLQELTALFMPLSVCEDYISPIYLKSKFHKCILHAIKFVRDLSAESLKEKDASCVFDLLRAVKCLLVCYSSWDMVSSVDTLRLEITVRMINIPDFNAKMNALIEVVRLTEEPFQATTKSPITADRVVAWIATNKIISITLGGNLHQTQYCDKIKSLVKFLGMKLTLEELEGIWEMQVNKNPVQVENIHGILAAAAPLIPPTLLNHLFQLIQKSWETASDGYREKLIDLIAMIDEDNHQGKTTSKILELLWNLAHLPQSSKVMMELALDAHASILMDSSLTNEAEKRNYIEKCVKDIRKATCVVSAFKQLHKYSKGFYRAGYTQVNQHQLAEFQKQYDLLRLTGVSLKNSHSKALQFCRERNIELTGEVITDGRYSHYECIDTHLRFIAFLLKEGALYMPFKRAFEVWDTLVANPLACEADRMLGFKWFDEGLADMEPEIQSSMFTTRVLKVDPALLDAAGYQCLRHFFEIINLNEKKLRKAAMAMNTLVVDNPKLTGIEYMWTAALEVRDPRIADELIMNIVRNSYQALNQNLKNDVVILHQKFIHECFHRLDKLLESYYDLSRESTPKVGDLAGMQSIERLLLLLQCYIRMTEESHSFARQFPPHGASFHGYPLSLIVSVDQQQEFILSCHSNESISSVRQKVAKKLNVISQQVQIGTTERWLDISDYTKLLCQLGFNDHQPVIVKTQTFMTSFCDVIIEEQTLPGVILASDPKTFQRLEQICCLGDTSVGGGDQLVCGLRSKLISGVRSVLLLIPTDPLVKSSLAGISHHSPQGAPDDPHVALPPNAILQDYLDASKISPYQLLYNMEVLSIHLMPVVPTETNAQAFRRNFLEAGGLKYMLQSKVIPRHFDLSVRQDCYAMMLSLSRYLLYNEVTLPMSTCIWQMSHVRVEGGVRGGAEDTPSEKHEEVKALGETITSVDLRPLKADDSGDLARLAIETMSVSDFSNVVAHLVRISWAAAAGKLHLASETDGEEEGGGELRADLCAEQVLGSVDSKNEAIACQALNMLVTCLNLRRSMLDVFCSLPNIQDFIIDVVLGCPSEDVRSCAVELFCQLCDLPKSQDAASVPESKRPCPSSPATTPHKFFLCLMLGNPTTLWEVGPPQQHGHLDQWSRSSQYFEFRSRLLQALRVEEQQELGIDVKQLLQNELEWMNSFRSSSFLSSELQYLLNGHLKLCRALFACEGVDKKSLDLLFSASKLSRNEGYSRSGTVDISPCCTDVVSRIVAFVELCLGCF